MKACLKENNMLPLKPPHLYPSFISLLLGCSPLCGSCSSAFSTKMTHPSHPPLFCTFILASTSMTGHRCKRFSFFFFYPPGCVLHRDSPAATKTGQFDSIIPVSDTLPLLPALLGKIKCFYTAGKDGTTGNELMCIIYNFEHIL